MTVPQSSPPVHPLAVLIQDLFMGLRPKLWTCMEEILLIFTQKDYLKHQEWTSMLMTYGTICIVLFFPI